MMIIFLILMLFIVFDLEKVTKQQNKQLEALKDLTEEVRSLKGRLKR